MCVSIAAHLHTYQWVPQFVARVAQRSRVGLPDGTSLDLFSVLKVDGARLAERGKDGALVVEQALEPTKRFAAPDAGAQHGT